MQPSRVNVAISHFMLRDCCLVRLGSSNNVAFILSVCLRSPVLRIKKTHMRFSDFLYCFYRHYSSTVAQPIECAAAENASSDNGTKMYVFYANLYATKTWTLTLDDIDKMVWSETSCIIKIHAYVHSLYFIQNSVILIHRPNIKKADKLNVQVRRYCE